MLYSLHEHSPTLTFEQIDNNEIHAGDFFFVMISVL